MFPGALPRSVDRPPTVGNIAGKIGVEELAPHSRSESRSVQYLDSFRACGFNGDSIPIDRSVMLTYLYWNIILNYWKSVERSYQLAKWLLLLGMEIPRWQKLSFRNRYTTNAYTLPKP